MENSSQRAKAVYHNMVKYWALYGILGSLIYLAAFWLIKGEDMIVKDYTVAIITGFLNGGVLLRWIAGYQLNELERRERGEGEYKNNK